MFHSASGSLSFLHRIRHIQVLRDLYGHRFDIAFDIFVGKSNHFPTLIRQVRFAGKILGSDRIVVTAVDLNSQKSRNAGEIGEKRSDGVLSSKLQAAQLFST